MALTLAGCGGRAPADVGDGFAMARQRQYPVPERWDYSDHTLGRFAYLFDRLDEPMDLSLQATPLTDALDQIAAEGNLPLHINWGFLRYAGVDREFPITIEVRGATVEQCLDAVLYAAGQFALEPLRFAVIDGLVVVSTPMHFRQLLYYRRGRL